MSNESECNMNKKGGHFHDTFYGGRAELEQLRCHDSLIAACMINSKNVLSE